MSKESQLVTVSNENVGVTTNEQVRVNQDFTTFLNADKNLVSDTLASVSELKNKEAFAANIAMTYLDLELGEVKRMLFVGVKEHTVKSADTEETFTLPGVVLVDEKKNFYIYCATQFVSTIVDRNLPIGTGIEFAWSGAKKTSSGGNMRLHTIKPLLD